MKFLDCVQNLFQHREINSIITIYFIFISFYIAAATHIGQNFLNPLESIQSNVDANKNEPAIRSIFIIFLLLCISTVANRILKLIRLPALLGSLLVGIIIKFIPSLDQFFSLPPFLDTMIRKIALVNIVIRWGLATDVHFLFENAVMPLKIGIITAFGEVLAVTAASLFVLKMELIMAVFSGLILTTVSPAVTVPAMINFKEQKLGNLKKIPDNILAICCVDNLSCVIVFMVLASVTFTSASVTTTILLNAGTIILGVFGGLGLSVLLWKFPRPDEPHTQFSRISLLGAISVSLTIGSFLLKYSCSGFLATLILSTMCAFKWKSDNKDEIASVVSTYRFVWDVFFLPLLFLLLGMKFEFSTLTIYTVLLCVIVITIGLLARFALVMLVTMKSEMNVKEKIVIVLSLLPRATFQADLAPTLVLMCAPFPDRLKDAELILKACILSVLFTAPVFDVLLNQLGRKFLKEGSGLSRNGSKRSRTSIQRRDTIGMEKSATNRNSKDSPLNSSSYECIELSKSQNHAVTEPAKINQEDEFVTFVPNS